MKQPSPPGQGALMRRALLAVALAVLGAGPSSAGGAQAEPGLQGKLDAIVRAPQGPPGVSVLITRDGKRRYLYAGAGNVRTGRPPHRTDHFRIASATKGFSSLIAVSPLLRRHGVLLDTRAGRLIPDVLPKARRVRVDQLLQHTSGLADYIRQKAFVRAFSKDPAAYLSPLRLTGFVKREPLEFTPGSRYHYSDTDNIAVGLMAERATGRSFGQLLGSEIFGPLGMDRSLLPSTVRMPEPYIRGYELEPGKAPVDVSELINPAGAWASGGIVSTPLDLARFLPKYVPAVLKASKSLTHPFRRGSSSPPGPGRNSAGIGIFRYRTGCGTVYGHTGSFPGYRTLIAANASGTRSVVFMVNAQIVPGDGSPAVSKQITRAQAAAVCLALRGSPA